VFHDGSLHLMLSSRPSSINSSSGWSGFRMFASSLRDLESLPSVNLANFVRLSWYHVGGRASKYWKRLRIWCLIPTNNRRGLRPMIIYIKVTGSINCENRWTTMVRKSAYSIVFVQSTPVFSGWFSLYNYKGWAVAICFLTRELKGTVPVPNSSVTCLVMASLLKIYSCHPPGCDRICKNGFQWLWVTLTKLVCQVWSSSQN